MKGKSFVLALLILCVSVQSEAASFRDELTRLEGVVSVDEIVQSGDIFAEKYVAWFVQPIDWSNPSGDKFLQRVEIGFMGWDNVNVVNVDGYGLRPSSFVEDDRHELAELYSANYINIEYRYFARSIPEGLYEDKTDLWEYLNDYNASTDFHNIMEQLRGILSGTWVFTGGSKGGQATNVFSYYYPNDADAYVSYAAPFCNANNDPRLMEAVYTTIGNERYGEAKAKEYRDLLLRFQVEAIRHRDYLQPRVSKITPEYTAQYPFRTASRDFETAVADFARGTWQYDQNFASVDAVLKMPHDTSTDEKAYLEAMLTLLVDDTERDSADVYSIFPYMYQAHTENGNYAVVLKYLREAVEREGLSLTMTEADEADAYARMAFTDEQLRLWKFDPTLRNEMINWSHTTQSNVIMIYGNSDPWYFVRLPDVDDNPNVHIFTMSASHQAFIEDMPAQQKDAVLALLDNWLQADAEREPDTDIQVHSSSSGCNSGVPVGMIFPVMMLFIMRRKYGRH